MHPLVTFPILLVFERAAPFLIRIILGIFLISLGQARIKKEVAPLGFLDFVAGIAIILGFYTQISAILAILLIGLDFYFDFWKSKKSNPIPRHIYQLYTLAVVVLLSLLLSGAGAFALDMPF